MSRLHEQALAALHLGDNTHDPATGKLTYNGGYTNAEHLYEVTQTYFGGRSQHAQQFMSTADHAELVKSFDASQKTWHEHFGTSANAHAAKYNNTGGSSRAATAAAAAQPQSGMSIARRTVDAAYLKARQEKFQAEKRSADAAAEKKRLEARSHLKTDVNDDDLRERRDNRSELEKELDDYEEAGGNGGGGEEFDDRSGVISSFRKKAAKWIAPKEKSKKKNKDKKKKKYKKYEDDDDEEENEVMEARGGVFDGDDDDSATQGSDGDGDDIDLMGSFNPDAELIRSSERTQREYRNWARQYGKVAAMYAGTAAAALVPETAPAETPAEKKKVPEQRTSIFSSSDYSSHEHLLPEEEKTAAAKFAGTACSKNPDPNPITPENASIEAEIEAGIEQPELAADAETETLPIEPTDSNYAATAGLFGSAKKKALAKLDYSRATTVRLHPFSSVATVLEPSVRKLKSALNNLHQLAQLADLSAAEWKEAIGTNFATLNVNGVNVPFNSEVTVLQAERGVTSNYIRAHGDALDPVKDARVDAISRYQIEFKSDIDAGDASTVNLVACSVSGNNFVWGTFFPPPAKKLKKTVHIPIGNMNEKQEKDDGYPFKQRLFNAEFGTVPAAKLQQYRQKNRDLWVSSPIAVPSGSGNAHVLMVIPFDGEPIQTIWFLYI